LLAAPSARVVVTGSSAHLSALGEGAWCLSKQEWDRTAAYSKSKLANIMFAYEMARRTEGTSITANAMDPGGVATRFARNNGLKAWLKHLVYYAHKGQLISARQGADTIAYLAVEESLQGQRGGYYFNRVPAKSSPASHDPVAAQDLWQTSLAMSGLDRDLETASAEVRRIFLA